MKKQTWFKFLLAKAYFDRGWGLTNQVKYVLILLGIFEGMSTQSMKITLVVGVVYGLFCYFLGRFWHLKGIVNIENEVANIFNEFQKDVRKKLKIRNIYKA